MSRVSLYAFKCMECGKVTEFLFRDIPANVSCPACGDKKMVWLNKPVNPRCLASFRRHVRESVIKP